MITSNILRTENKIGALSLSTDRYSVVAHSIAFNVNINFAIVLILIREQKHKGPSDAWAQKAFRVRNSRFEVVVCLWTQVYAAIVDPAIRISPTNWRVQTNDFLLFEQRASKLWHSIRCSVDLVVSS